MKTITNKIIIFLILFSNFISAADSPDTFDIMYVYTEAAKQRAGGKTQVETLIHQSVDRINQSFINSKMNVSVNLVHIEEVSYPLDIWEWKGDTIMRKRFAKALEHLIGKDDGYMDNVHSLRDKYSADMVQLMISNAAYGGLSHTMFLNEPNYESTAFTALGEKYFIGSSVHELGHIMGNQHDIYNTSSDGTYEYSHGYGSPNNTFRTIMSYGNACNGVSNTQCAHSGINYWSSPTQNYNGEPLGAYYADARQTILNNANTIANFRQRPITTAPTLTTTPPTETYANTETIKINGTPGYEVYINGVPYSTLDANGKATITLEELTVGTNSFNIQLKDPTSGTLSDSLNFSINKKDITPVLIPVYYMLLLN